MDLHKRPEVWLLLALSMAGIAWVLWSEREKEAAPGREQAGAAPLASGVAEARLAALELRVSREEGHLILTLRVGAAEGVRLEEPLDLGDGEARLVTGAGESVPRFFLPFDPPPRLENDPGAFAELRYWLPQAQAADALWLEAAGERLAVKPETGPGEDPWPGEAPEGVEIAVDLARGKP